MCAMSAGPCPCHVHVACAWTCAVIRQLHMPRAELRMRPWHFPSRVTLVAVSPRRLAANLCCITVLWCPWKGSSRGHGPPDTYAIAISRDDDDTCRLDTAVYVVIVILSHEMSAPSLPFLAKRTSGAAIGQGGMHGGRHAHILRAKMDLFLVACVPAAD